MRECGVAPDVRRQLDLSMPATEENPASTRNESGIRSRTCPPVPCAGHLLLGGDLGVRAGLPA
eukprot:3635402-Prymnesium_polylepis.2